jgi:hypothetical protein
VIAGSTVIALFPVTRRVVRRGYTQADIVHALSRDLERDREVRRFELGSVAPEPGRVARRAAYAGLGVAGVGVALSFVGSLDPVVGVGAMLGGFAIALAASVVGALYARRRQNVAGEWWLKFWQSRAGAWAARVAGLGLTLGRLSTLHGPNAAMLEAASAKLDLSKSQAHHMRDWVKD